MSAVVSRSKDVTVLTLTTDPSSVCPPFFQLLGALCYSPRLCAVSRRLTPQRGGPQAVLGALWILSGLLHLSLGLILITNWKLQVFLLEETYCPVWLGVLFVLFGVCCILTERYPSECLVLLSGLLNVSGAALSIAGIVLYSTAIQYFRIYGYCHRRPYDDNNYSLQVNGVDIVGILQGHCEEAMYILKGLSLSILAVLVTLSVLDLCLGISSSFLSFRALKRGKNQSKTTPLMDEAKATSQDTS